MGCYKCELLAELYEQVPKTPRNYYVMTELIVLLHGSDVCREGKAESPDLSNYGRGGGDVPVLRLLFQANAPALMPV